MKIEKKDIYQILKSLENCSKCKGVNMYRVVRASTLYYNEYMKDSKSRYGLITPFLLLVDSRKYDLAKRNMSPEYLNLCDIVSKMKELYMTGESKYHHFNMLLDELQILGFDLQGVKAAHVTQKELLKDQIDLLLQFLSFRYPFEEFDNRIGVHDIKTNEFIFIQP